MRINQLKAALCSCLLCAAGFSAPAAGLRRADVAGNAAWMAHLDCDSLRPTEIGKYVLEQMENPDAKSGLSFFQGMFGFDLRTQLNGVTLYGPDQSPENAVMLIYADFDADHLVNLAKSADDYRTTTHNKHVLHSWVDQNKPEVDGAHPRTFAAIQGNRVIFAQRQPPLERALDVLDAKAPSLADGAVFPLVGKSGNTHFFEAAARKLDLPDSDPNAAILKLAKWAQLVVGEENQEFRAQLSLLADNAEAGSNMVVIANGLKALVDLQKAKPESVRAVDAIQFTQDGPQVAASIHLPADAVLDILKANAAQKAADAAK